METSLPLQEKYLFSSSTLLPVETHLCPKDMTIFSLDTLST